MRLSTLIGARFDPDPVITGLSCDSRTVRPGDLFAALAGDRTDGARFIADAEAAGAAAVLAGPGAHTTRPLVTDDNPRRRLAAIAARFFPRQPEFIAGVTGTNGKTSTAVFVRQLWAMQGVEAASLGTLGASAAGYQRALDHTTPEPITLHRTLDELAARGVTHLAMEVSSHASAQYRVDGVRFTAAAFTNITQDHLDYHQNFEDYLAAKLRLFADLLSPAGYAVINIDGAGAMRVMETVRRRKVRVLTTGGSGADLHLLAAVPHPGGIALQVAFAEARFAVDLPLIGRFQAENALVAAGVLIGAGADATQALEGLRHLTGAPGRMQRVAEVGGAAIYVDYAHTPDAIETVLNAVRPHAEGKVIVVLGAGGDRDRSKRPLMGRAAAQKADLVIVTDDNPRTEEPASIRADILKGAPDALEIGDRADAIAAGVSRLHPGDVLVIAGKGHETGQIVGDRTLAFNDAEVARSAVLSIQERQ